MRYDVHYHKDSVMIDRHFCREADCYGTNKSHGYTLDQACEEVALWHEEQAKAFREKTHYNLIDFLNEEINKK